MKAMILYESKKYEESFDYFNKLIEIDSSLKDGHTGKGMCLVALFKHKEAIPMFDKAIQIDSVNYVAHLNMGRCFFQLQNYEFANCSFHLANEIAKTSECYLDKACSLFQNKQFKEAIECFTEANKLDKNNILYSNIHASCFLFIQKYADCINCTDLYLKNKNEFMKNEQKRSLLFIKGQALYKLKNYKDAIIALNLAKNMPNNDSSPQYDLLNQKMNDLVLKCKTEQK